MKTHKPFLHSALFLLVSLLLMSFRTADERAAEALARQVMGSNAKAVIFEQTNATTDSYELLQKGNRVLIHGAKKEGGPEFVGIGSTLEGFGLNEPVYEAMLSQAWDTGVDFNDYIDNIADRHLERIDPTYRAYWHTMVDKFCTTHTSTGAAGIINAHPNLEGEWNWTTELRKGYDIANLDEALAILEKVEGKTSHFTIITVWGDSYRLEDYANRDWDGLIETYYKVRWQKFFDAVLAAYDAGEPFVNMKGPNIPKGKTKEECERAMKFDAKMWDFECKWARLK